MVSKAAANYKYIWGYDRLVVMAQSIDPMLTMLVDWADKSTAFGIPLTFQLSSIQVAGSLVSQTDYIKGMGEYLASVSQMAESPHMLAEIIKSNLNVNVPQRGIYIHLKDVVVISSSLRYTAPWWRGQLSEINGFVIGVPQLTGGI